MRTVFVLFIALFILTGCTEVQERSLVRSTGVTALEILDRDPAADIFQLDGVVYGNASEIDWVRQKTLTAGKKVGIVEQLYQAGQPFEDRTATRLPVGAEIFEPAEDAGHILIVKVEGKEIRYLGLIEG